MSDEKQDIVFDKPLTAEQVERGREILCYHMVRCAPAYAGLWKRVFGPDDPAKLAPSDTHVGKVAYTKDAKKPENRTRTTLGRYVKRNLNVDIDFYVEDAITRAMAALSEIYPIGNQFTIVYGQDVVTAYRNVVGAKSCMTGTEGDRQKRVQFYANNPEAVGMLLWRGTPASAAGRALRWQLDDGRVYLERIYAGDLTTAHAAFKKYAAENGITMGRDGYGETPENCVITIRKPQPSADLMPHLDSFQLVGKYLLKGCPQCESCGVQSLPGSLANVHGLTGICEACVSLFALCNCCHRPTRKDQLYVTMGSEERRTCASCIERYYQPCRNCRKYADPRAGEIHAETTTGNNYCIVCVGRMVTLAKAPRQQSLVGAR